MIVPSPRPRIRPVAHHAAPANSDGKSTTPEIRLVAKRPHQDTKRKANSGSFVPNQSGNLKGRPPGAKGVKATVRKVLVDKVTIQSSRGAKKVPYLEALLKKEAAYAAEGDWRARRTMFELAKWALGDEVAPVPGANGLQADTSDDTTEAILEWFKNEISARESGATP